MNHDHAFFIIKYFILYVHVEIREKAAYALKGLLAWIWTRRTLLQIEKLNYCRIGPVKRWW